MYLLFIYCYDIICSLAIIIQIQIILQVKTYSVYHIYSNAVNVCVSVVVKSHVPGSVFTDLMRNGILQDPYYRFNDVAYRHYCYLDWNYRKMISGCLFTCCCASLLSSDFLLPISLIKLNCLTFH